MNERRRFLAGLPVAAGLLPVAAAGPAKAMSAGHEAENHAGPSGAKLYGRSQFPEAAVETHDGQKLRLYADLIRDKVVAINFMTIANEETFPISAKLAEVAKLLGNRLGEEVRMISISGDPQNDSSERLRAFAERIGAPKGWYFVRASEADNASLTARLYRHGRDPRRSSTVDIIHYGNDAVGLWAAFPAMIQADDAAARIASVMNGKPPSGPLVQAGPRRLGEPGPAFNNRAFNNRAI